MKNNKPRNPMENIGNHDFFKKTPKQPDIITRSYFITRDIDKKINRMKIDRDGISVSQIVQEALEQYFKRVKNNG